MNGRLNIEEVGVDLELCVHAHGHDVYPIMGASCNNNYSLDIISFGICELSLCNHGSDHIFSLISFIGQVKYLSCTDQYTSATSVMLYLRVLPCGIPIISQNHITSYEFFFKYYLSLIPIFPGF